MEVHFGPYYFAWNYIIAYVMGTGDYGYIHPVMMLEIKAYAVVALYLPV